MEEQFSTAPKKPIEELTNRELEAELTIAASTPNKRRFELYQALLRESEQRRLAHCGG